MISGTLARIRIAFATLVVAASGTACSALLDWSGFTGGGSDAGADASTSGDASDAGEKDATPQADGGGFDGGGCGDAGTCAPLVPPGWTGPLSLYVGPVAAGAPPACPLGGPVFDGNADLGAPPASCTSCTCSGVGATSCLAPVVSFFSDSSCSSSLGTQIPTTSCSPSAVGATAVTVAAPQPTGGTCAASGGQPMMPLPGTTWGRVARACSDPATGAACGGGGACAPAPPSPYSTSLCIMQAGAGSTCPGSYPLGPEIFYTGVTEGRGCSTCTCGTSGASCAIAAGAIGVYTDISCSMPVTTMSAPSSCTGFLGPLPIELRAVPSLTSPGACSGTGGGTPTGAASGAGATTFCCTL